MEKDQKYLLFAVVLLSVAILVSLSGDSASQKDTINSSKTEGSQINNSQNQNMNKDNTANSAEKKRLDIETLKEGAGDVAVKSGDTVEVHYVGTFEDGTKFDSSVDRGQTFVTQIGVGNVIKGWDEGIVGMKVGEKRKLTIGSDLAYGDAGRGTIPGGATLIFEVELVSIK